MYIRKTVRWFNGTQSRCVENDKREAHRKAENLPCSITGFANVIHVRRSLQSETSHHAIKGLFFLQSGGLFGGDGRGGGGRVIVASALSATQESICTTVTISPYSS